MNATKFPFRRSKDRLPARKKFLPFAFLRTALLLTLPLRTFLNAIPTFAQDAGLEGQRVAEVRVLGENGEAVPTQAPELTLKAGDEFHFASERESLRAIYATGDYANVRVRAMQEADGLHVDFLTVRDYYNNVIRIEGLKEPPTEPEAQSAVRLNLGEPFREASLREGIARLVNLLQDEGLFQAKATYDLQPYPETRQMDVNIHVVPGGRARIGDVTVKNQTKYSDAQLLKHAKLPQKSAKVELTMARQTQSRDRLRKYLVNQGYLGASVLITPGGYDAATNTVPLTLDVTAGPHILVVVNGARLSGSNKKKLLPIYAEGAVDEDLLQEGRRNIRDYFQRQGYFNATVDVTSNQDQAKDEQSIQYSVDRGERYKLVGITIEGNKYFSRELISARLQLQTASFQNNGRFSQQIMKNDADAIKNLYLTNGFLQAQVTPEVNDTSHGKKNDLAVAFHIVEGEQTRISSLQVDGNKSISTDDLLSVISLTDGQPFSEAGVASDRNNVLAYYFNDGFPEATFTEQLLNDQGPNKVGLIYHIAEGPRIEVNQVLLTGYQYTRPSIIARQVEVKAGGPLRQGDVADSERQLYNLGIFNRVQIAAQNPDGSDPNKTAVTEVREGNRYTIGYGGGFEVQRIAGTGSNPNGTTWGASPRGIFEIARANMFGRAQTLSFTGRTSTLEYRATINYSAQNFLTNRNLSLQLTAYADKSQDVDTFTSTRFQGGFDLVQKASKSSSFDYQYFYRRVEASNVKINSEQIPLLSQPTRVSGFGLVYARDRRDNPADATRGSFNTFSVSDAIKGIGSGTDFLRFSFQNSTFHPLGRQVVFARSTQFGFEQVPGNTAEADIPLPERFFAGGATSLRGFSLNQAGPRDPVTGFPIGGLAVLTFIQELRFPMQLPIIGNRLGGTLFYDGGNVYSDVNQITLRWRSPSPTDLNYFSHTVGFGIRYPTPVGPVRVDIGYQLNPAQYQVQTTVNNVTTTTFPRLPHFGFFFNIGSTF